MIEEAIRYAQSGYAIFRCEPGDKKPFRGGWQKEASRDPARVEALWRECSDANIGLPTGSANGLWVLDADGAEGLQWLHNALETNGGAPSGTIAQATGGGGMHLFFGLPSGLGVRNSAGTIAPNIDVRGDGGYVVLPPSLHPNGNSYAWSTGTLLSSTRPPTAPDWLWSTVHGPGKGSSSRSAEEWSRLIDAEVAEGGRNNRITQITGLLLRKDINLRVTYSLVRAWNNTYCQPPLEPDEVERTVESIAKREYARRGVAL